jgi:hypothetical protein
VFKQIYLFNSLFPYFFSVPGLSQGFTREINNVGYDNDHLIREIKIFVTTPVFCSLRREDYFNDSLCVAVRPGSLAELHDSDYAPFGSVILMR